MNDNLDYEKFFNHVKNLKQVILITTGRTGSDFFQSLLDGHSQVLQITGTFFFHKFWKNAVCKENLDDLLNEFIWNNNHGPHIAKFKSKYNHIERWDQLGVNKNENFDLDIDIFKKYMLKLMKDREINSLNFFICLHIAYGLLLNQDILETKILFYHLHHIEKLEDHLIDFKNFDVICTIREPRNTIVSGIENHKNFNFKPHNNSSNASVYFRVFYESEPITKFTQNVTTLKLEDLHQHPDEVLSQFCKKYEITLDDNLYKSTYHNKLWWGDKLSGKYLQGFNKNIDQIKWYKKFYLYENLVFEFLLYKRLSFYKYKIESKFNSIIFAPLIFLIIPLPLKYEVNTLYENLKKAKNTKKIKTILLAILAYSKRLVLYYKYFYRRLFNKVYISKHFYKF